MQKTWPVFPKGHKESATSGTLEGYWSPRECASRRLALFFIEIGGPTFVGLFPLPLFQRHKVHFREGACSVPSLRYNRKEKVPGDTCTEFCEGVGFASPNVCLSALIRNVCPNTRMFWLIGFSIYFPWRINFCRVNYSIRKFRRRITDLVFSTFVILFVIDGL